MIKVLLDISPLQSGHSHRGIGAYTRELLSAFEKSKEVQIITDKAEQYDLHHMPFFDLFHASIPALRTKPLVVTIHDVIPLEFPNHYKPGKKGKLSFWYQKSALKKVAAVLTDSDYSKQQIQKHLKISAQKINVTHLAASDVLQPASSTQQRRVRTEYQLPARYALYVGDINYNKNIPQLIKMLKFLPEELQLVCVGKNFRPQAIPEWQWIEAQLELSQVRERVHFVTSVDTQADLAAVYSAASVYVQPSLSEGFGLPVLEAMRCKCLVVSSDRGSLPEIGGEHAWYAEPVAEQLAEQVKQVLNLKKSEQQAKKSAAADWAQTFSWKKTAKQTLAVYKSVLGIE